MNKQKSIFIAITTAALLSALYISMYVNDNFFRPFFGDFLVVVLIYSVIKSILKIKPASLAIGTLLFSFFVEATQYFHLIKLLGLQDEYWAIITMGSSFSFMDLLMYFLGVVFIYVIDLKLISKVN